MSEAFNTAMEKTFIWEGGESDHPDDSGGHTNFGITWRTLKRWNDRTDVENLTKEEAKKIYNAFYWVPLKCNKFKDFIAYELFDAGVNCGMRTSSKFLQHALNFLNLNGKLYPDLKVDGKIGDKTINAYKVLIKRGNMHEAIFIYEAIKGERYHYYRSVIWFKKKLEIFFRSWLRRII